MKVIDLLNKIANGEEVSPFSVYDETFYINNDYYNYIKSCDNETVKWAINEDFLNQEIKIIEEEKKIPEKVDFDISNFSYKEYELNIMRNNVIANTKAINQIIDYLKSKGDE